MKRYWKPILLLIVLSPFLAEVMSGATPIFIFFAPFILVSYALLLYGLQVLVIREVAMRRKLGLLGLWCLGLIYALYNEGLRAQTLFFPFHAPIEAFSAYGLVENIRLPWLLAIGFWHALYAVVYPILFVEYLMPGKAKEQWLSRKATWVIAILSLATGALTFFGIGGGPVKEDIGLHMLHFVFLAAVGLILWVVAGKLPRSPRITTAAATHKFSWKAFLAGAAAFALVLLLPFFWASLKLNPILFVLYFAILTVVGVWAIARCTETTRFRVMLFALGGEIAQAIASTVIGFLTGNLVFAASSILFAGFFVWATVRLMHKHGVNQTNLF